MHPEILYFGYFEAEKIEFEVGKLNFKNFDKFSIFFGGGYFNFETQSPIKKYFFSQVFHVHNII